MGGQFCIRVLTALGPLDFSRGTETENDNVSSSLPTDIVSILPIHAGGHNIEDAHRVETGFIS
jgi:hypothetical protein